MPVFQLTIDVEMTRAVALREQLVARMGATAKPTLSDVLTKVSAERADAQPRRQRHFGEDGIKRFPTANVGIAVAAPQGLVVPVIQRAESLTIPEIADARADVVGRARDNKLRQGDLDGGTFTISNLGMFGVEQFIAVLNPPQAAILAVGSVEERPVVRDGEVVVRPMMTVTLTCDHRSVDGADGARFLGDVKAFLEEPGLALCDGPMHRLVPRSRPRRGAPQFYRDRLGFTETCFDAADGWSKLERSGMEIALTTGEPEQGGVAHVEVDDVKEEAARLRAAGRRGRGRGRAARRDAPARGRRSRRQPHRARPGRLQGRVR